MDRVILHVDQNAFFASVEALSHPETMGKPMAVCGDPENRRGIVLAKNELAKKAGVKTAESVWQALRKCPGLILLPPHHHLYAEYCDRANEIYERFTDLVERAGIDESYLDVTGTQHLFGSGREIAGKIRQTIREELGLTVSVGVSFCKVFAKLGSDYKKPDATTEITRNNVQSLLHPLPVTDLMYVGRATADALAEIGVHTVGQLAALDRGVLTARLGKHGSLLYDYANGLDREPVRRSEDGAQAKSVGNSLTFRRDLVSREDVRVGLRVLSESVAYRLRRHGKKCRGVQVAIRDTALRTIDRQTQLPQPTHLTKTIYEAALALVLRFWKPGQPIRLLAVTAINLTDGEESGQLSLFEAPPQADPKQEALDKSLDDLKSRYGKTVVRPASILKNDLGIEEE
ncbi:MAG: DNA polymerase IV [Oscillospiraceae bacterium]|jgi:DNA polymerase-4|nr:DNA polymerase IV [Oscillospiraceae bacterium]